MLNLIQIYTGYRIGKYTLEHHIKVFEDNCLLKLELGTHKYESFSCLLHVHIVSITKFAHPILKSNIFWLYF